MIIGKRCHGFGFANPIKILFNRHKPLSQIVPKVSTPIFKALIFSTSNLVFVTTDVFFTTPLYNQPLSIGDVYFTDQSLQTKVNNERLQVGWLIENWRTKLAAVAHQVTLWRWLMTA